MTQPFTSIFLCSYNQVAYIDEAIRSAVQQDYENLEVVVGDDGSTDGTVDKILAWTERYPHRIVPVLGEHLGITGNCNRLLRACRGKFVIFHAGDDVLLPGRVKSQVEWFEQDDRRVLCGHDVEAFDSDTGQRLYVTSDSRRLRTGLGARRAIEEFGAVPDLSLAIRASALPPGGYDERVGIVSVFKLQVDVLAGGGEYGYVPGVLARYRVHRESLSRRSHTEPETHRAFFEGMLTALALTEGQHPDLVPTCKKARARLLFSEGRWHQGRGDAVSARSWFAAAASINPALALKAAAGIGFTYLPSALRRPVEALRQRLRRGVLSAR
jgi:glycosyltransferase involved in cell wall biosynthesis